MWPSLRATWSMKSLIVQDFCISINFPSVTKPTAAFQDWNGPWRSPSFITFYQTRKAFSTWPWTRPGMGHPQLLWITYCSVSLTSVKNFFLMSDLNLLTLSLKSFPLGRSWQTLRKMSLSIFLVCSVQALEDYN